HHVFFGECGCGLGHALSLAAKLRAVGPCLSPPTGEHREMQMLEEAIAVLQAGSAHPLQLGGDVDGAIRLHPSFRVGELARRGTDRPAGLAPRRAVYAVQPWRGTGDVLGVDEDAARAQPVVYARKE